MPGWIEDLRARSQEATRQMNEDRAQNDAERDARTEAGEATTRDKINNWIESWTGR